MKFSEIITLAKQGYKPGDIKELMALAEPEEEKADPEPEKKDPEPEKKNPEPEKKEPEPEKKEPEENYKVIVDKLKKQIADLQQQNTRTDISREQFKTDQEILNDLYKSII